MHTYRSNPPSRSMSLCQDVQPGYRHMHAQIIRCLALTGMSESDFGRRAVRDPAFVSRMRSDGYAMQERTARRVRSFIAEALNHA